VAWDPLNPPSQGKRANLKKDNVNPLEEEEKSELAKIDSMLRSQYTSSSRSKNVSSRH